MIQLPPFKGFVRTFIFACLGVFIFQTIFANSPVFIEAFPYLALTPKLFLQGAIYQPFTWMFLHGGFGHLFWNMLVFYLFAWWLEESLGAKRFMKFVLISGYLSGLIVVLFSLLHPYFSVAAATYAGSTIGASGVILAIVAAIGRLFPQQIVIFGESFQ
jgi:membrane associated rhomboid family serine protease